jgi:hypothetical protein
MVKSQLRHGVVGCGSCGQTHLHHLPCSQDEWNFLENKARKYIISGLNLEIREKEAHVSLPNRYLTSVKKLEAILNAIQGAQAPDKFTLSFLESLEFKSASDRLIIGVLKSLGFLDDTGKPTDRYFRFLDQTQGKRVLAEGIKAAYSDLFQINTKAQTLSKQELIQKFKTLSQGKIGDAVLDKMAMTFLALAKHADFADSPDEPRKAKPEEAKLDNGSMEQNAGDDNARASLNLGGLVYNIQIVLPESRDHAVYDALFQSLRRHLV